MLSALQLVQLVQLVQLQQQELLWQQEQQEQQELQQVFRHKRSRQEPTGQQQEQRVSLSIPWEIKLKSANFYLTLKASEIKAEMHPEFIKPECVQNQRRRILALGYRKSSGFATFFAITPVLWWMPTGVRLSTFP